MKKTVFISSTFEDMKEYRSSIWDLLTKNYDVEIKGMEDFGARMESPLDTCLAEVSQSDIYVGLIGTRLGSVNEEKGKSYTQLEYERALETGKEVLIYLLDENNALILPKFVDKGKDYIKLESFKSKLRKTHTVDFFVNVKDLEAKLKRKFDERLSKQEDETIEDGDEILQSEKIIQEFELFPKSFSGQEIKMKVKFKDKFFPASKDICNSFNKPYGNTVIVSIVALAPSNGLLFDKILVDHLQFEVIKEKIGYEAEIYANLLFTEDTIDQFKAYFRTETITTLKQSYLDRYINQLANPIEETVTYQREGTLILSLNEII